MQILVVNFEEDRKGFRCGYFDLLYRGVLIKRCAAHHQNEKTWFTWPATEKSEKGRTWPEAVCRFVDDEVKAEVQTEVARQLYVHVRRAA